MSHDIFVSYSSEDKAVADAVVSALENSGLRCWVAPRDIKPSADWGDSITEAISACKMVLLIFSGHSNQSKRVRDEIYYAISEEKIILPFRIENLDPTGSMRLHLSSRHWLDAFQPSWQAHLNRLVGSAADSLGREPVVPASREETPPPALAAPVPQQPEQLKQSELPGKRIPSLLRRLPLVGAVLLLCILLSIGGGALLNLSQNGLNPLAGIATEMETLAATDTPEPTATKKATICVIIPEENHPFYIHLQESAAKKVEELGYTALILFHDYDTNKQIEQIETCIAKKVAAIILESTGEDDTIAAIQKAKDAGIPTFLVHIEISKEGVAAAQILANDYQGATILAEYFAQLMGEKGKYIELTGADTNPETHIRSQAYHDVLDKLPDLKMITQQTANWDQNEGYSVIESLLRAHPDVKGVICGNDAMALGAQAAVIAAGRKDVIVVGFDGNDDAIQSIMKGELKATVLWPVAEMAIQASIQADLFIRTGSTGKPEKQSLDFVLLTPENACQYTHFAPNGKTSCP